MLMSKLDDEKAAQTRIIASISHDIKTPLTSVLGYAEFLQNPNLSEERRKKYLATIYEKAKVIQQTVIGFDDYLSHNLELNLHREFVTVGRILSDAENGIRTEMWKDGLFVEFEKCGCENITVYADTAKLQRVFMNAVTNSARHSGKNTITVTVSAKDNGPDVLFTVRDDGKGVKRDQLDRIFEPMYTTDTSRSVAGLGLSICKDIIESHGGSIYADSVYNEYFALCFTLQKVEQNEV
jgi:signal transduction histidine kinase